MQQGKTYVQFSELLQKNLKDVKTKMGTKAISETVSYLNRKNTYAGLSKHLQTVMERTFDEDNGEV